MKMLSSLISVQREEGRENVLPRSHPGSYPSIAHDTFAALLRNLSEVEIQERRGRSVASRGMSLKQTYRLVSLRFSPLLLWVVVRDVVVVG
jgi:hypothetical protein